MVAKVDSIMGGPQPARRKIHEVIALHIESATRKRVYYAIVLGEQTELSGEALRTFSAWSHEVTQDFAHLLEDYAHSEGLAPSTDMTALANLTLTMLTNLLRWYEPDGPTAPDLRPTRS